MYWSTHFHAYLWVLKLLWIEYLTASLFTGGIVALAAKGREMVATMTLGVVLCLMIAAGYIWLLATTGNVLLLSNLPLQLTDPLTIVTGGIIVRRYRSAVTPMPLA